MKNFSEYLSSYIEKSGLSMQKAAKQCGIDRTLLMRYASGQRTPRNMERVLEIAHGMGMTENETQKFCEAYQNYRQNGKTSLVMQVLEQAEQLAQVESVSAKNPERWKKPQITRLKNKEEIYEGAAYLGREAEKMILLMNPQVMDHDICSAILGDMGDCQIIHIMKLYGSLKWEDNGEDAADLLKKVLPLLYSGKKYQGYSYYQNEKSQGDIYQLNTIVSTKGILLWTRDYSDGLYVNKAEYQSYYESMMLGELRKCQIFSGTLDRETYEMMEAENSKELILVAGKSKYFYLKETQLVQMMRKYIDSEMKTIEI
jgi:transcriptional regulator with XRE-family HTH domain